MTVPLLIGAPIFQRAWILDRFFDAVEAQDVPVRFLFGLTPGDDGTEEIIFRRAPDAEIMLIDDLPSFGPGDEDAPDRYATLAEIRNRLLDRVCEILPTFYLSLDSDILLRPLAVDELLRTALTKGAALVGWAGDMGGSVFPGHWSWMDFDEDGWPEREVLLGEPQLPAEPFRVGVIMGAKLMAPRAYLQVRYSDHLLGEDVAFSLAARRLGIDRWLCPTARGVHHYGIGS